MYQTFSEYLPGSLGLPQKACSGSMPLNHLIKGFRLELGVLALPHQMPTHIDTKVAFSHILIRQRLVSVGLLSEREQSIGTRTDQDLDQFWVALLTIVFHHLRQIMPIAYPQTSTKPGDEVAIQVKMRMMGIQNLMAAILPPECSCRMPGS